MQPKEIEAWFEGESSWPQFLKRPSRNGPQTTADLAAEKAERRRVREQGEAERIEKLAKAPRAPVSACEILGIRNPLTLKAAAERIGKAGGEILLIGEELVVDLPARAVAARNHSPRRGSSFTQRQ